jgi:hypothetical protein
MKRRDLGWVFQRGSIWWIQYSFHEKRYQESSGSTVKMDAVKLLRRRMAEMSKSHEQGPDIEARPSRIWRDSLSRITVTRPTDSESSSDCRSRSSRLGADNGV